MTLLKTLSIALLFTVSACGVAVVPEDGTGSEPPPDGSVLPDASRDGGPPIDVPAPMCTLPDGRTLRVGETATSGCTICTCQAGAVLSCAGGCVDAGPPPIDGGRVCRAPDGNLLRPGESWFDGCNRCLCLDDGSLTCSTRICPDDPPPFDGGVVCRLPDGRILRPGESAFDGCNSCFCNGDGSVSCTTRFCPDGGPPPPDAGFCVTPDGRVLRPGESSFDGCNSCFCGSDGRLSCTTRFCEDAGPPDAGACNTVTVAGPFPSISASSGSAPAPIGGTLIDGRYELVSGVMYGPGGVPTTIGRMTVQISGGVWQMAVENMPGSLPQRFTYWYMTMGTSLTLALVCGGSGGPAPTFGYDANPMVLALHVPAGPGGELVLQLVRR